APPGARAGMLAASPRRCQIRTARRRFLLPLRSPPAGGGQPPVASAGRNAPVSLPRSPRRHVRNCAGSSLLGGPEHLPRDHQTDGLLTTIAARLWGGGPRIGSEVGC